MKRLKNLFFCSLLLLTPLTAICATPMLVAGGRILKGTEPPLLSVSTDGGNTWTAQSITGLTSGAFFATNCLSNGTVCIAAGETNPGASGPPLLAVNANTGNTWTVATVPNAPASGVFSGTSCTGAGSTAICTAVGENFANLIPVLAVSTNGGATWTMKTVANAPANGYFLGTSCTGTGATAICTAAGQVAATNIDPPMLAVSTNGGATWTIKTVANTPPTNGSYYTTSCTGTGTTAICTVVGIEFSFSPTTSYHPLLAVSRDGGATWSPVHINNNQGLLFATSCTGTGATAICTAAGQKFSNNSTPLLIVSRNGGVTWTDISATIPNLPTNGQFNAASCTGTGATAICIAAGQNLNGDSPPLLVVSTNGGVTWSQPTIPNLPAHGLFKTASCVGTGATAVCTAAGQINPVTGAPLLVVSTNGGVTWNINTPTNNPTAGAYYNFNDEGDGGNGGNSAYRTPLNIP